MVKIIDTMNNTLLRRDVLQTYLYFTQVPSMKFKVLISLLFSTVFLLAAAHAQEDPNYIRNDNGKIVLGITCPDKNTKKTRLIVEAIISDADNGALQLNPEQTKEFETYLRNLEDPTTATAEIFVKDVVQKIKEMLGLEKSPKMKAYQFSVTSMTFRSRLPKK